MALDHLTTESEEVRQALALLGKVEQTVQKAVNDYVPSIGTERYLTGNEVCDYLHISTRTLQTLRDTGQITYTVISGRVFLYPEAGIREILQQNYRPAKQR